MAMLAALAFGAPAAAADAGGTEVALDAAPNLIQVKTVEADPPAPQEAPKPAPAPVQPKPAAPVVAATADSGPTTPGLLRQLTDAGGWAMYGVYACAAVVLLVGLERALALRARKVLPHEFVRNVGDLASARPADREKILTYCVASPSPVARVFQATMRRLGHEGGPIGDAIAEAGRKERQALRHNGRAISGAACLAPLLGLLGAATALIGYYMDVSANGAAPAAGLLAESLWRALVPVAAGLAVAIPAAALCFVLAARIDRLVAEMGELAAELVETLEGPADSGLCTRPRTKTSGRRPNAAPGETWGGPAQASV